MAVSRIFGFIFNIYKFDKFAQAFLPCLLQQNTNKPLQSLDRLLQWVLTFISVVWNDNFRCKNSICLYRLFVEFLIHILLHIWNLTRTQTRVWESYVWLRMLSNVWCHSHTVQRGIVQCGSCTQTSNDCTFGVCVTFLCNLAWSNHIWPFDWDTQSSNVGIFSFAAIS